MQNNSPIKFVVIHLRFLLLAGVIGGILAFIFTSSFFISPKYKSETIVYVPHLAKKVQLLDFTGTVASQVEINAHIQLLQSTIILDSLIKEYDIVERFHMDVENPNWRAIIYKELSGNIDISKTKFSSISIAVKDEDPEMAAEMANAIVRYGDRVKSDIFRSNSLIAFGVAEQLYLDKLIEVRDLEYRFDSIVTSQKNAELNQNQNVIKELDNNKKRIERDLYSSGNYSAYVSSDDLSRNYRAYVDAQGNYKRDSVFALSLRELSGKEDSLYKIKLSQMRGEKEKSRIFKDVVADQEENLIKNKSLFNQIERYDKEIGELKKRDWEITISDVPNRDRIEIIKLRTEFENEIKELIERKNDLERELAIKETFAPQAFVISKAFPTYKPASPKRGLISVAAFLFCSFLALMFVKVKEDGLGF